MPLKLKWKFRNEAMINSHECGDNFIFPTRWQPHGCSGCERTYFLNLFEKMLQKIVERILKMLREKKIMPTRNTMSFIRHLFICRV